VIRSALLAIFVLGLLICALNFFLSFLQILRLRMTGGKSQCRFISGLPLIGSLFTTAALMFLRGPRWVWISGVILAVLDTGGIHWFFGSMVWHQYLSRPTTR
jgi:hypothetical protein